MNHFDRNQSRYLAGGGSVIGGITGRKRSEKIAKKDAQKYGLKEGTMVYDEFIRRRKDRGTLKGAGVGGALGFGASKGIDLARGKVVADMAKARGQELGKNYLGIGKGFRGIKSSKDINTIMDNWKETGEYVNSLRKAVM